MKSTAAGLAALGRGPDSMLIHMSPGEVKGLQALALAHGGSLTTNPHTGLPEAGFLSSVLPVAAGVALTAMGVPPPIAGLMVGGVGAMATGSLSKGLMMGLGAYGGAGLGSAFSAAGAAEGSALASSELATASNAATEAGTAASNQITQLANAPIEGAVRPSDFVQNPYTPEGIAYMQSQGMPVEQVAQSAKEAAADAYKFPGYTPTTQVALDRGPFGNTIKGVSDVFSGGPVGDQARDAFMKDVGGMKGLAISGGAAAAPFLMNSLQPGEMQTPQKTPTQFYKTSFSQQRNPRWGEPGQPYFTQSYAPGYMTTDPNAVRSAGGGLMNYADGGYVPESGSVRIPTIEDESNESRVPDTKIKFAGYAPEKSNSMANLSELQLKLIAARATDPEKKGAAIRELYVRQGTQQPGSQFISSEKFMAADGGVVPAPQMPTSPLFQQSQAVDSSALDNYLAGLGQNLMGGAQPQVQPQGPRSINPAGVVPSAGAFSLPGAAASVEATSDVTKQYLYNPATQRFDLNPNYAALIAPIEADNSGGNEISSDAAGGPIKAKYAAGGLGSLPEYAAGGKLLDGPGDGVSDSIPAVIKGPKPQRAALADGEFVIPARIVSELGNGSTKAGAKRLYAMMDRVQKARQKTTGKDKVAVNTNPNRLLPA